MSSLSDAVARMPRVSFLPRESRPFARRWILLKPSTSGRDRRPQDRRAVFCARGRHNDDIASRERISSSAALSPVRHTIHGRLHSLLETDFIYSHRPTFAFKRGENCCLVSVFCLPSRLSFSSSASTPHSFSIPIRKMKIKNTTPGPPVPAVKTPPKMRATKPPHYAVAHRPHSVGRISCR
jgi:hypothetical protein